MDRDSLQPIDRLPPRDRDGAVGAKHGKRRCRTAIASAVIMMLASGGQCADAPTLRLDDLLHRVMGANLNVASETHELDAARADREGAWSVFEPQFNAEFTREANRRLNSRERFLSQASPLFDEHNNVYGGSLEMLSPIGTRLRYGAQVRDLRNNLQLPGQNEWDGFAGVTLTQPLLKNFGLGATMAPIRIARAQADVAFNQARGNVSHIVSSAEVAYWDLYGAAEEWKLRRRSVEIATKLLEDNRARVEAGRMGDLEVLQAEAGVVLRETQAAESEQRTLEASALLRAFLGETVEGSPPAFVPADAPSESDLAGTPATLDSDAAFAHHPDYLARAAAVRGAEQRDRLARNHRLPQFDMKASYGFNGLGGRIERWYDVATSGDYPSWFFGFELTVPVGPGIKERAEVRAAHSRLESARDALEATHVDLVNEIEAARQRIDHLRQRVVSYDKVIAYHDKVLTAELAALDLGRSDSRRVLQAEQDLTEVRTDALQQRLELRRAIIQLEMLEGDYLARRGLDLSE